MDVLLEAVKLLAADDVRFSLVLVGPDSDDTDTGEPYRLRFEREYVELPPLTRAEMLYVEFELLGLSVGDHIMALYRPMLPGVPSLSAAAGLSDAADSSAASSQSRAHARASVRPSGANRSAS